MTRLDTPVGREALAEPPVRAPAAGHAGRPWARRRGSRRLALTVVLGTLVVGAAAVVVPRLWHRGPPVVCGQDALQADAVAGLGNYAQWLQRNGVPGYIGEVGWPAGPDGKRWNALADTWYNAADRIGLPVTAWAAARWPESYPMAVYRAGRGSSGLDSAGPQATVVEDHPSTRDYLRGVVLAGGSFGAGDASGRFSSTRPGAYGYDYSYENSDTYAYLADHHVRLVRLTMTWERLQPVPGGSLDGPELARLQRALDYARRSGVRLILDLHNYGEFVLGNVDGTSRRLNLGSAELPTSALADFWSRLAQATKDDPAVFGYDLLNEPVALSARGADGARLWEQSSQEAVSAIRHAGSSAVIAVAGYGQTSPAAWGQFHPTAWIRDSLGRVVYEAHVYFDSDSSGHYAAGYADELRRAQSRHAPLCRQLVDLTGTRSKSLALAVDGAAPTSGRTS